MAQETLPYTFSEAFEVRSNVTERERLLDIQQDDREWLTHVKLSSQDERQSQGDPMFVEAILVQAPGAALPFDLAGAFLMSRISRDCAFLYTPAKGIEHFKDYGDLLPELQKRLNDSVQRDELLRYVSLKDRSAIAVTDTLKLSTIPISGDVLTDRQQSINDNQRQNRQALMDELLVLPSLKHLINDLLKTELRSQFADWRYVQVTMISHRSRSSTDEDGAISLADEEVSRVLLADAVLDYAWRNGWPAEQHRTFTAAVLPVEHDVSQWESAIIDVAINFRRRVRLYLETFWNTDLPQGQSRKDLFSVVMGERFRAELLQRQDEDRFSGAQVQALLSLYPPVPTQPSALALNGLTLTSNPEAAFNIADIALAGVFSIKPADDSFACLFTPHGGLKRYRNSASLQLNVLSLLHTGHGPSDLLSAVTQQERHTLLEPGKSRLSTHQWAAAAFPAAMQSIIDKQLNNVDQILSWVQASKGQLDAYAAYDQALDIRAMIDAQLMAHETQGRWSTRLQVPKNLDQWSYAQPYANTIDVDVQWRALTALKNDLLLGLAERPGIRQVAIESLSNALTREGFKTLHPEQIHFNTYDSPPTDKEQRLPLTTQTLLMHFLERYCGVEKAFIAPPNGGFFLHSKDSLATPIDGMDSVRANAVERRALDSFLLRFSSTHRAHYNDMTLLFTQSFKVALDNEVRVQEWHRRLPRSALAIVEVVLKHPARQDRQAVGGFVPDVFNLSLHHYDRRTLYLDHCLLITERGGLDPQHSGRVLLWIPSEGLRVFPSLPQARREIDGRLLNGSSRHGLLNNLPHADRTYYLAADTQLNRDSQKIHFELIVGDCFYDQHQVRINRYINDLEQAAQEELPVQSLQDHLHNRLLEGTQQPSLDRALATLQNSQFLQALPPHLKTASAAQLKAFAAILDRHREEATDRDEGPVNPVGQFLDLLLPHTHSTSVHTTPLKQHLDANTAEGKKRRESFSCQLFWQTLAHGFSEWILGNISDVGYNTLKQVLGSPDGLAREMLNGQTIVVRPLQLKKSALAVPAPALGLYLIGPEDEGQGPLLLYSLFNDELALTQYPDQSTFLSELLASPVLREQVLERLSAENRSLYTDFLRNPQPELTLSSTPVDGDLFKRLFDDSALLLCRGLEAQSATDDTPFRDTLKRFLEEEAPQLVSLLSGELRIPVLLARAVPPLKHSAELALAGQWEASVKALASGLFRLALAAETPTATEAGNLESELEPTLALETQTAGTEVPTIEPPVQYPFPTFSWGNVELSQAQIGELHRYQVTDISLADLNQDLASGLYRDSRSNHDYAPVAGKVFRVIKEGERWRMTKDGKSGCWLKRNAQGEWQLDLKGRLAGGGQIMGRMARGYSTSAISRRLLKIKAVGMPAINSLYPEEARVIRNAHDQARAYLNNCLRNLKLLAPGVTVNTQTRQLVKIFFNQDSIDSALVNKLEQSVRALLNELLDASMSPVSSTRYVVGIRRFSDDLMAFVVPTERVKKIYLSDMFFTPQLLEYVGLVPPRFDIHEHAVACTLIHELSHACLATEDIDYVEAVHPFYDLIRTSTAEGRTLRDRLQNNQRLGLSIHTPREELFTEINLFSGLREDVSGNTAKVVLEKTGTRDLINARRVFMSDAQKRNDVILANADSLTLLISQLGRRVERLPRTTRSG